MHYGIAGITSCELEALLINALCRIQIAIVLIFIYDSRKIDTFIYVQFFPY